jgi:hypothetical protein
VLSPVNSNRFARFGVYTNVRPIALAAALLLASACESATTPTPSATPQAPVATVQPSRAPATTRTLELGNGLVVDVPLSWSALPAGMINRATYRQILAGNGDLTTLATVPGNGDIATAALPSDRVVVAVQSFCRLRCNGPEPESALPLVWAAAVPLVPASPTSAGKHELALGFRWFDQPMFVIARWSDGAPPADVAAVERIVRSIRPEPTPPQIGEYNGWDGIGPLGAFSVGSVTLRPLPPGAVIGPGSQIYNTVPYFLVRGRQNLYSFASKPLVDHRCEIQFDAVADRFWCQVDSRRYEWTRFGRYLGPEPQTDLVQHRVIVRDGLVWVRYIDGSLNVPSVLIEAAER